MRSCQVAENNMLLFCWRETLLLRQMHSLAWDPARHLLLIQGPPPPESRGAEETTDLASLSQGVSAVEETKIKALEAYTYTHAHAHTHTHTRA